MQTPRAVWDGVLRRLGTELSSVAVEAWLHPLEPCSEAERALRLLAPTPFHCERVRRSHLPRIQACVLEEVGEPWPVTVEVATQPRATAGSPTSPAPPPQPPDAVAEEPRPESERRARASGRYAAQRPLPLTFETFVVGPENALAREASLALARGRSIGMSPLYLTGPSGNGKSHLACALAHTARREGAARVRHVSAEGFTTQLLGSIRGRNTHAFKRRFRQECDLLVLEDIQFLAGKKSTQLELFHTLEHLRAAGAGVAFTGDRLPRDIEGLDPRLGSQLASGLVAEIEPPDAMLRREILRAKAAAGGVRLPEDCLERLVEVVRGSVRDLEGVLIQLVASAALLKRPIDLELTERALRKVAPLQDAVRRLTPREVVEAVASFHGTTPEALASRSRRRDVLVPRQLAMYLCRRYTDASLPEIGRELRRDHPSVKNAVEAVERAILQRAPMRYRVEELTSRLDALTGRRGERRTDA